MKVQDLAIWTSFYWVAREKSFIKAAQRLKVGAPLLSKRIAKLEEELGVRLFHRTTRKVSLTHEGRSLLPQVESLLADFEGLEERFRSRQEVAGTIRLACVTGVAHRLLAPLLSEFTRLHPHASFELEVTDSTLDLIDHQLDLAIRVQEPKGADFVFKKLMPNNLVLCASPAYLKKATRPLRRPDDLRHHRFLTLQVYENCRFKGSELTLGDLSNARQIRCESGLFLTELACQGAGIAARSRWDVHSLLKSEKLVPVLERFPLEPFGDMYAVIPTRRLLAHRVRVFVDYLTERAKSWAY